MPVLGWNTETISKILNSNGLQPLALCSPSVCCRVEIESGEVIVGLTGQVLFKQRHERGWE